MNIDSLIGAVIGAAVGSALGFAGAWFMNSRNRSHRSRMAGRALIADLNTVETYIRTLRDIGYAPISLVSPVWTELLPEVASLFADDLDGFSKVAFCYFHIANAEYVRLSMAAAGRTAISSGERKLLDAAEKQIGIAGMALARRAGWSIPKDEAHPQASSQ